MRGKFPALKVIIVDATKDENKKYVHQEDVDAFIKTIDTYNPDGSFREHFEQSSFMLLNSFNDLFPLQA